MVDEAVDHGGRKPPHRSGSGVRATIAEQTWPVTTAQVTIPMFGDPLPFESGIGDDIRWVIESDERFPMGLDGYWRIVGVDFAVADEGLSTAVLPLNQPPGTGTHEPPT